MGRPRRRLRVPQGIVTRVADSATVEEVSRAVDRVAEQLTADELAARDDARTAAGEG